MTLQPSAARLCSPGNYRWPRQWRSSLEAFGATVCWDSVPEAIQRTEPVSRVREATELRCVPQVIPEASCLCCLQCKLRIFQEKQPMETRTRSFLDCPRCCQTTRLLERLLARGHWAQKETRRSIACPRPSFPLLEVHLQNSAVPRGLRAASPIPEGWRMWTWMVLYIAHYILRTETPVVGSRERTCFCSPVSASGLGVFVS